ncbi:hypothetical protein AAK938_01235 [Aerococcaceae bacterium 50-4]
MAKMKPIVITDSGQSLLAKLISGQKMTFTKAELSSKKYTDNQIKALTKLEDVKQSNDVVGVTILNEKSVQIEVAINNTNLEEDYYLNTIGLYANDPVIGEVLYAVTIAETADYVPAYNGKTATGVFLKFIVSVSNTESVSVEVSDTMYATHADISRLNEGLGKTKETVDLNYQSVSGDLSELQNEINQTKKTVEDNYKWVYDSVGYLNKIQPEIEAILIDSPIHDKTGSPGPKYLMSGNQDAGFFGLVAPEEFGEFKEMPEGYRAFNGKNLAMASGVVPGIPINDDTYWLKFYSKGKIVFIPFKPIRHSVSFNDLPNNQQSIYPTFQVGHLKYTARLIRGTKIKSLPENVSIADAAVGSEWNSLLMPLHKNSKYGLWPQDFQTSYWGDSFTNEDFMGDENDPALAMYSFANGGITMSGKFKNIARSNYNLYDIIPIEGVENSSMFSWRPVLEVYAE